MWSEFGDLKVDTSQSVFSDLGADKSQSVFSKSLVKWPFSLMKYVERLHNNVLTDCHVHTLECDLRKKVVIDSLANNVSAMQHYINDELPDLKVDTSQSVLLGFRII